MTPEESELAFLGIVRSLSRYGIHTYTATVSVPHTQYPALRHVSLCVCAYVRVLVRMCTSICVWIANAMLPLPTNL